MFCRALLRQTGVHFGGERSKQPTAFIVGDGGSLGEGSVSLLAALSPAKPPRLTKSRSALGEEVTRYKSGIEGDFRFVIFTGTASHVAGRANVTTRTAEDLRTWIEATATERFARSSIQDVTDCSSLALPIVT